jgi:hypothetical protein
MWQIFNHDSLATLSHKNKQNTMTEHEYLSSVQHKARSHGQLEVGSTQKADGHPGGAEIETETAEMRIRFDRAYAWRVIPLGDSIYL